MSDSEKIYIQVSYNDKDHAKALGAKWDATKKSWYIFDYFDVTLFAKWYYNLTPAIIKFTKNNKFYVTRIGDIELGFSFDKSQWLLYWIEYCNTIKCLALDQCILNNCFLGEIISEEYCPNCPKEMVETVQGHCEVSNYASISKYTTIEEVRKIILHDYQALPHNHLNNNKYLYRIMHSPWIY